MNFAANRCVECDEIIANPICSDCLAKKIKIMVSEHDEKLAEMISSTKIGGNTICIRCNNEMGLCAHCFTKEIYELLKENNVTLAEKFKARFNFNRETSSVKS
jgi:hypothetical protein